jgi:hypothetical protein
MKRVFFRGGIFIAAIASLVIGAIIRPQTLFAHTLRGNLLEVYSDTPIDEPGGRAFIDRTESILAKWPIQSAKPAGTIRLFIANTPWRRQILFTSRPQVGGLVYFPLSGTNAFLSGADFENGLLIARSGAIMQPPRTLAYYGAHEAAHLLTGRQVGTIAYLTMPEWIREGVADYVALEGAADYAELAAAAADLQGQTPLGIINRFGVYPKYRLLVAYFLEREGWSVEQLLGSGMSLAEAERQFAAGGGG